MELVGPKAVRPTIEAYYMGNTVLLQGVVIVRRSC